MNNEEMYKIMEETIPKLSQWFSEKANAHGALTVEPLRFDEEKFSYSEAIGKPYSIKQSKGDDMSKTYVNRSGDEEIIDIVRTVLDNGTAQAETAYECILIKLMQIRNTPILNMKFDQERVDKMYENWKNENQQ